MATTPTLAFALTRPCLLAHHAEKRMSKVWGLVGIHRP